MCKNAYFKRGTAKYSKVRCNNETVVALFFMFAHFGKPSSLRKSSAKLFLFCGTETFFLCTASRRRFYSDKGQPFAQKMRGIPFCPCKCFVRLYPFGNNRCYYGASFGRFLGNKYFPGDFPANTSLCFDSRLNLCRRFTSAQLRKRKSSQADMCTHASSNRCRCNHRRQGWSVKPLSKISLSGKLCLKLP